MSETKTFKRDEINSIVEQLKAIEVNGDPVFTVRQEGACVLIKIPDIGGQWMYFPPDPSEPGPLDQAE